MRPLRLKLKCFTSFREEQELDFADLDLFAIAGPTGSGKSSLLDAMTYALFGTIERVGKQVSQLISQGQPRMAVTMEFEVGGARYRVTRTTPRSGSTKALLERADGDEWVSAGEGADRVTEVNKRVVKLIGLDYDAFTRSVLLPQGKFAEFLVGDPGKRREILTELLGLALFKVMAQRANEIAKEARQKAETTAELLEREYEGVSEEALAEARATVAGATGREEALSVAGERLREIAERWRATEQTVATLRACARDARDVAEALTGSAATVIEHGARLETLLAEADARRTLAVKAREQADAAAAARAGAEAEHGAAGPLIEARAKARVVPGVRAAAKAAEDALAKATTLRPAKAAALEKAEVALGAAELAFKEADRLLEDARETYATLQRAEALAAACVELHAGDACPVCGSTLTGDPPRPSDALTKAEATGKRLKTAREKAEASAREAQRARDTAERDAAEAEREIARLSDELGKATAAVEAAEAALADAFGGAVPDEAEAVLDARISALEKLSEAEAAATRTLTAAETAVRDGQTATEKVLGAIAAERARLEAQPLASIAARAAEAAPGTAPVFEPVPADAQASSLATWARASAATATDLGARLDALAERTGAGEACVLAEATEAVGDLLPVAASLDELVASLVRDLRKATEARASASTRVDTLVERLAKRAEMKAAVDELDVRANRFKMLALELRADRLVAFLQEEALHVLCVAGTDHLLRLSDTRYRLVCEEDEFQVVDTWNGDEQRSVRTLSGGETFMASLALALALSEQQPSLAVESTARIDSLFLDEGFGTLDPDSLEEVVQAIEQLGGDGRLVGVITHIRELADRLPARIMVEKSPSGSRFRIDN